LNSELLTVAKGGVIVLLQYERLILTPKPTISSRAEKKIPVHQLVVEPAFTLPTGFLTNFVETEGENEP